MHFVRKGICIVCVFLLFWGVAACTVQTPQEYYSQAPLQEQQVAGTVYLSIDCSTVLQNMDLLDPALKDGGLIPEDGKRNIPLHREIRCLTFYARQQKKIRSNWNIRVHRTAA